MLSSEFLLAFLSGQSGCSNYSAHWLTLVPELLLSDLAQSLFYVIALALDQLHFVSDEERFHQQLLNLVLN